MSLVIDSSITLAWYFIDEQTAASRDVLGQVVDEGASVPALWRFEVANALQMSLKRQRIDKAFRDRAITHLGALDIVTDAASESYVWSATLKLAERHGLTVYDAAYLELAQRRRGVLATLDAALIRAANVESITVVGPDREIP